MEVRENGILPSRGSSEKSKIVFKDLRDRTVNFDKDQSVCLGVLHLILVFREMSSPTSPLLRNS